MDFCGDTLIKNIALIQSVNSTENVFELMRQLWITHKFFLGEGDVNSIDVFPNRHLSSTIRFFSNNEVTDFFHDNGS